MQDGHLIPNRTNYVCILMMSALFNLVLTVLLCVIGIVFTYNLDVRPASHLSTMDVERLSKVGKDLGLDGQALIDFIARERDIEKEAKADKEKAARDERAHQLELKRQEKEILEMKLLLQKTTDEGGKLTQQDLDSKLRANAPKLPCFNDKEDLDAYLNRFERYAASQRWLKQDWAVNLSALLTGKALQVFTRMPVADAGDYEKLKKALLDRFQLNKEGFRAKFKEALPEGDEGASQFATRLSSYFDKWIDLSGVDKKFEELRDFIIRDRLISVCGEDLAIFLREKEPKSVESMTKITKQFLQARGSSFANMCKSNSSTHRVQYGNGDRDRREPSVLKRDSVSNVKSQPSGVPRKCFLCGKSGHMARDCRWRGTLAKVASMLECDIADSDGAVSSSSCQSDGQNEWEWQWESDTGTTASDCSEIHEGCECVQSSDLVACMMVTDGKGIDKRIDNGFVNCRLGHKLPVLSAACEPMNVKRMPVSEGTVNGHKVSVLRDTGCSGVVVRQSLVSGDQFTGETKKCILIDGTVRTVPVAYANIKTQYFSGVTKVLCMNNPIYDLILGNTDQVQCKEARCKPNHRVSEPARPVEPTMAVQTRSKAREGDKVVPKLKVPKPVGGDINRDDLIKAQQEDRSLRKARDFAVVGNTKRRARGCSRFFYDGRVLCREYVSPRLQHGDPMVQVVVPEKYRVNVMQLAHEGILGGHLAAKKTSEKVMTSFYWPGIGADILRYCRSCDVCQRTLPKGKESKVPLSSMPLIDTPFQRIAVDIVGPIYPMTDRKNRYILTIVDYATRYPEAIALPNIEAQTVAEALVTTFSRVGIPREILTDQGAQFTSEVMRQVSQLLSIRQLVTTPYHLACNGLVERFNGTLKQMLKRMCSERPQDWDRYIDALLFAYRDVPQESLGFSPFELLYGRQVRGPMGILRELWTGKLDASETKTVYQYVVDLKNKLVDTCQLAQDELTKSSRRYKRNFDIKARKQCFAPGDEVLLLLPTDKNKLLMQWKGPFRVVAGIGDTDYRVELWDKSKVFHVNLLKKYYRREVTEAEGVTHESTASVLEVVCVSVIEPELDDGVSDPKDGQFGTGEVCTPHAQAQETVENVHIDPRLTSDQATEIKLLLSEFKDVLTDVPGATTLEVHDIKLTCNDPIRSRPYPLPNALRGTVRDEVRKMLELGVIEESHSPYASPVVLVKKKDGSVRFCVDFRKLNQITIFDSEPIPDQEEIYTRISNKYYFSKFDLSKGYWQVPLAETVKALTAFITPDGLFQFTTMPFGLVNAQASFSRLMRKVLREIEGVDNYVDDILVYSSSWEEHVLKLKQLLKRLREVNLTARPSKCYIGFEKLEFLGHVIGLGQLAPNPVKVKAVQQAPPPKTKKQLRSFLGLANYYRKFIPNFAAIAVPLTDRTRAREPNKITWGKSEELAFNSLKEKLCNAPILRLPNLDLPFVLQTDASDIGLGAVLLQEYEDGKFPVAYASRKLLLRERAYSTIERECLAIVWGIQKFEPYLYGKRFILETDHQPLAYMNSTKVVNNRVMRWALALQPYKFQIVAIKGSDNVGADYLSRIQ